MVVYADILIVVNTIVDYFLIKATCLLKKKKISVLKQIIASILGGISSLYIFLQNTNWIIDFSFQCIMSFIISIICFGVKRKQLLSSFLILVPDSIFKNPNCNSVGLRLYTSSNDFLKL